MIFILNTWFGTEKKAETPATLAELLLHTPDKEKLDFLTQAAKKSNEDQRATFERTSTEQLAH